MINNISGTLTELISYISKADPFQKKSLEHFLTNLIPAEVNEIEKFSNEYLDYLFKRGIGLEEIALDYVWMCKSIINEQIYFKRNGTYRYKKIDEVINKVYSDPDYMEKYMIGVGVSQMLWNNHHTMYNFWKRHLVQSQGTKYLEIGVGHGMFFKTAVQNSRFHHFIGVDISETSLTMTKQLINNKTDNKQVTFILEDIMNVTAFENKVDFVTMGEVLEHVEQPGQLISKISDILNPNGKAYISTCANAPVIDHIYLFNNLDEIRSILFEQGLLIVDEVVICNDNTPMELWETRKANLSYAAICKKR